MLAITVTDTRKPASFVPPQYRGSYLFLLKGEPQIITFAAAKAAVYMLIMLRVVR